MSRGDLAQALDELAGDVERIEAELVERGLDRPDVAAADVAAWLRRGADVLRQASESSTPTSTSNRRIRATARPRDADGAASTI